MNQVRFEKLSANATTPKRATLGFCGFDLYAAYDTTIPSFGYALVLTDISIKMPKGVYALVAPRSGLALMYGINVGAGVIDPDYRGQIGVVLFNHGDRDLLIKSRDRCAQLIFEKYLHDAVLVEDTTLEETDRGDGAFGSTGINDLAYQSQTWKMVIDEKPDCNTTK